MYNTYNLRSTNFGIIYFSFFLNFINGLFQDNFLNGWPLHAKTSKPESQNFLESGLAKP